mmetsp:Transcript_10173/g.30037  ORF Transcript_10173/g.30037 Transcript_10173/m.30037 type:complete len:350 (+) Transcript_10173:1242-2291(+)
MRGRLGSPAGCSAPKGMRARTPPGTTTSSGAAAMDAARGATSAACRAPSMLCAVVWAAATSSALAAGAGAPSSPSPAGGDPRHSRAVAATPMASWSRETACTTDEQPAAARASVMSSLWKAGATAASGLTTQASASLSPERVSTTKLALAFEAMRRMAARSLRVSRGVLASTPAPSMAPTSRWSLPPRARSSRVATACASSATSSAASVSPRSASATCRSTCASMRASKNSAVSRLSALRCWAETRDSQCWPRRSTAHSRHEPTAAARCSLAPRGSFACLSRVTPRCVWFSPRDTRSDWARARSMACLREAMASSVRPRARSTSAMSDRARASVATSPSSLASARVFSK